MSKPAILVVDDEVKITDIICNFLAKDGFEPIAASGGSKALELFERMPDINLVLLDWMMPDMNGMEVFRKLRERSDVPVIFLTAKSDEVDKLIGLELGADDYITKPFSIRELSTRIRVVLRRFNKSQSNPMVVKEHRDVLTRGALTIDLKNYSVTYHGTELTLTPTEFKLLALLASSPGRVYSRLQLLEVTLGEEYAGYERSIDTHISNLRKKIESNHHEPKYILTVFGIGYKFGMES